jgi:hypothetical protein
MKVSITVVATNTLTAGRRMLGTDEDIKKNAGKCKSTNLAQPGSRICDRTGRSSNNNLPVGAQADISQTTGCPVWVV